MYNVFKNGIYSHFYSNFVKDHYSILSKVEGKEEIYYDENKIVIVVLDSQIGERLYNILKVLKDSGISIAIPGATFKIDDYAFDKKRAIKWFSVEVNFTSLYFKYKVESEKLSEIVAFVEDMQKNGFVLDSLRFEYSEYNCVSEFLSYFIQIDEENMNSHECILNYVHYMRSGGEDLKDFYNKLNIDSNIIFSATKFPYCLPIVKLCYEYYKSGTIPNDIYDILRDKLSYSPEDYYLIALEEDFDSKLKLTERTAEYSVYNKDLKIYHEMSECYSAFLNCKKLFIDYQQQQVLEKLKNVIVNLNGDVLGYRFSNRHIPDNSYSILEVSPKNQKDLINFISNMLLFFSTWEILYEKLSYNHVYCKTENFDIENSIIVTEKTFKVKTVKALFELIFSTKYEKVNQVFFKLLLKYLTQKYGPMQTKEEFFEKLEVRALSPILAGMFINFALGNPYNANDFQDFLKSAKSNEELFYDSKFEYDPAEVPFTLDTELKSKYDIKFEKDLTINLPDGRLLVTFKKNRTNIGFREKEMKTRDSLKDIIDDHIKIVGISEVIYSSTSLTQDGMYKVAGFITQPVKGNVLTEQFLMNLNNKDLYKVAGYLFVAFERKSISWESIWVDNDFNFYINIFDSNFKVEKKARKSNITYVERVFTYLLKKGYNPNAFVDVKLDWPNRHKFREYLLDLANSSTSYCDEHNIFYDGSQKKWCPVCSKTKYLIQGYFLRRAKAIFEDSISEHYNINDKYNLKLYKKSVENIAEIEENIDKILVNRLNSMELNPHQDCFVPVKKALNGDNEFIGYIYPATHFEKESDSNDVCIDLANLQKLKNLPRLKSLSRLLTQIKDLGAMNLGFIRNPFEHVFLNPDHKKQVQISNVEFLCEGNTSNTIAWVCDYVFNILVLDDTVEFTIEGSKNLEEAQLEMQKNPGIDNINKLLIALEKVSSEMTKYCSIHQMYYNKKHLFCPKCMDKKLIEQMDIVYDSKLNYSDPDISIGEGGESFIYPYDTGTLIKVFKEDQINSDLKNIVLIKVLERRDILEKINGEGHKFKYVIPEKILVDNDSNNIFAYTMEQIKNAEPISSLRDKVVIQKLGFTKKDVMEILITAGEGIETLHKEANIFIGDLNGANILFDKQKNVYFLDFDGVGIDDILPIFCTDGYIDPVSKESHNITMKDDWYSFAIQAFYYLTFTHPFNGNYYETVNGKKVRLDIPARMKRRLSLLGQHGITAPTIAESWDWMIPELKDAFLNTFEKDLRESIVPLLKKQYETLFSKNNSKPATKIHRINSKFIAKEIKPFTGNVSRVINPYAVICGYDDKGYISVFLKKQNIQKNFYVDGYSNTKRILVSDDEKILLIITSSKVHIINIESLKSYEYDRDNKKVTIYNIYDHSTIDILNENSVFVNGNTLYYINATTDDNKTKNICIMEFLDNGQIRRNDEIVLGKRPIKGFWIKQSNKFIFVKRNKEGVDEIYCNSEKYCEIDHKDKNAKYNIIYDDIAKSWLVISNEGIGVVIKSDGDSRRIEIAQYVSEENYFNICFRGGNIYIPNSASLHIVNVNGKSAPKEMDDLKIMETSSIVYDVNNSGFSVITGNTFYEVRRG